MDTKLTKLASLLAFIIGAMAIFSGGKALFVQTPGYNVITWLLMMAIGSVGFTGIAVTSLCLGISLQGGDCGGLGIQTDPVDDRIVGNRVTGNGTATQANAFFEAIKADLIWDGSGTGNCWSANRFDTSSVPWCRVSIPSARPR